MMHIRDRRATKNSSTTCAHPEPTCRLNEYAMLHVVRRREDQELVYSITARREHAVWALPDRKPSLLSAFRLGPLLTLYSGGGGLRRVSISAIIIKGDMGRLSFLHSSLICCSRFHCTHGCLIGLSSAKFPLRFFTCALLGRLGPETTGL